MASPALDFLPAISASGPDRWIFQDQMVPDSRIFQDNPIRERTRFKFLQKFPICKQMPLALGEPGRHESPRCVT